MDNITFATEILKKLGIQSHIVDETDFRKIDLGLRGLLFKNDDYTTFLNHTLKEINDKIVYRYMDEYRCCYIVMKLCEKNKYFFIGPYLTSFPDDNFIETKIPANKSSEEAVKLVEKFYMSLPLTDDDAPLIAIASAVGKTLWGAESNFSFEYADEIFFDQIDPTNIPEKYSNLSGSSFHLNLLETTYKREKELMETVSSGKTSDINYGSFSNVFSKNFTDSLRQRKNNLISLNTLLKKAAEQGGVHPLHIDKLFSLFSGKAEEIHSVQESIRLQNKMIKDYCFLVKKHYLSEYSSLIGKVITLIDYDISANLTLKSISEQLFVNPSYLSGVFSREMGITLTEYVHHQRLERAVMLLHKTDMQIQDIASDTGFSDANYFIRVFKKRYGITPAEYKKNI